MVQQARPSGGSEQARAIRRASAAPSSLRSYGWGVLGFQGGLEALFDETLADTLDGANIDLDGLGDLQIVPGLRRWRMLVGFEQDAGMPLPISRGPAPFEDGFQLLPLGRFENDTVKFAHSFPNIHENTYVHS